MVANCSKRENTVKGRTAEVWILIETGISITEGKNPITILPKNSQANTLSGPYISSLQNSVPYSEPEASILKDLALEFSPHVWIGVHSGMCAMFMPYDHIAKLPKGKAAKAQYDILKKIHFENRMTDDCLYGSGGETVGYAAHGTATDYMYMVLNVPLAFTWEIYGDEEADYLDCYKAFNPTTDTDVKVGHFIDPLLTKTNRKY